MSKEVAAIGSRVKTIREERDQLDEEEEVLWERFFEICDDTSGEDQSHKELIPEIGRVIAREMHQAAPRIMVDRLKEQLTKAQWVGVTVQVRELSMNKLELQIAKGNIDSELVKVATEYKDPVPHKKFGEPTKKEMKDAQE